MWNRKEIKEKGKIAFKANRLICILAALIITFAGGETAYDAVSAGFNSAMTDSITNKMMENYAAGDTYEFEGDGEEDTDKYLDAEEDFLEDGIYPEEDIDADIYGKHYLDYETTKLLFIVISGIVLLILVFCILEVFLLNPLLIGARKFFVENSTGSRIGLKKANIGIGFDNNHYMNLVGAMFTTELYKFLWSLLLIVPGWIKAYEWRMVSYLLGEHPDMSGAEARKRSSEMMRGNKWEAFILDMSFMGWMLLGRITFGISDLIYTKPYIAATGAELYLALCRGKEGEDEVDEMIDREIYLAQRNVDDGEESKGNCNGQ